MEKLPESLSQNLNQCLTLLSSITPHIRAEQENSSNLPDPSKLSENIKQLLERNEYSFSNVPPELEKYRNMIKRAFWYLAERELLRIIENIEIAIQNKDSSLLSESLEDLEKYLEILNRKSQKDNYKETLSFIYLLGRKDPTILLMNYPAVAILIFTQQVLYESKEDEQQIIPLLELTKKILSLFPFKIEVPNMKTIIKEVLETEGRLIESEQGSFVLPVPVTMLKQSFYEEKQANPSLTPVSFLEKRGFSQSQIKIVLPVLLKK